MSRKFGFLLVLLLVVPLVFAACGGDDKDDEKGGASVELTQTFTGASGVTVRYPAGWVAEDAPDGTTLVANSQATLDAMKNSESKGPAKDQTGLILFAAPTEQLGGMPVKDAFQQMTQSMAGEGTTVSDLKDVKVGSADAYRADISDPNGQGFAIGFESEGALVIAMGVAATDEMKTHEATLLKIVESISYKAPSQG